MFVFFLSRPIKDLTNLMDGSHGGMYSVQHTHFNQMKFSSKREKKGKMELFTGFQQPLDNGAKVTRRPSLVSNFDTRLPPHTHST